MMFREVAWKQKCQTCQTGRHKMPKCMFTVTVQLLEVDLNNKHMHKTKTKRFNKDGKSCVK